MRDDFVAFILTHGRPHNVETYPLLRRAGYTGRVYFVIDDEDAAGDEYRRLYGNAVLTFSKDAIAPTFDEGDNFRDRRCVVYARNACWGLARDLGVRYFIQLDDDYDAFWYKFDAERRYTNQRILSLDDVLEAFIEFLQCSGAACVAMAQMGDFPGGAACTSAKTIWSKRKVMNTFVCDTEHPFTFVGRVNEDVNTYVYLGGLGRLFFQIYQVAVNQGATQANAGGMTGLYLDGGTYAKSFYPILWSPSCVRISAMGNKHLRIHHQVKWEHAVPCIIREGYKRPEGA